IINELLPAIETKYSVWGTPAGRAIGGISRGADWSIELACQYPDLFGIVGAHSPAITSDLLIGTSSDFSMLSLARSLDEIKKLRIHLDAGERDWAQSGVRKLGADLSAAGLTYTTSSAAGTHSDAYWASRMADYLTFYTATWPRIPRAKAAALSSGISARQGRP
ncbi:MAG: alpha/beta hydrolase-fold protein, partial [Anaerolineae bacterium]|nr:esterase family protein [Thermoflexales bacterium]MDW8407889.1 alpha/beta hydrolase-fold protein [Anaerolineae bacterium]